MLKHQLSNINVALLEALLNLSRGNGWIVYQKTFGLRKGVFYFFQPRKNRPVVHSPIVFVDCSTKPRAT